MVVQKGEKERRGAYIVLREAHVLAGFGHWIPLSLASTFNPIVSAVALFLRAPFISLNLLFLLCSNNEKTGLFHVRFLLAQLLILDLCLERPRGNHTVGRH